MGIIGPHLGTSNEPEHKRLHLRIGHLRLARAELLDADEKHYKDSHWRRTFGLVSQHLRVANVDHGLIHDYDK